MCVEVVSNDLCGATEEDKLLGACVRQPVGWLRGMSQLVWRVGTFEPMLVVLLLVLVVVREFMELVSRVGC